MNVTKAKLIKTGHFQAKPGWHVGPNVLPFHAMMVVTKGKTYLLIDDGKITIQRGDVLLNFAGNRYEQYTDDDDPFESYFVCFSLESYSRKSPIKTRDMNGRISLLMRWLFEESRASSPHSKTICNSFLHTLLAEFLNTLSPREDPLVTSTRDFMRSRLDECLTLEHLADNVHLSKYHFLRKYKQLSGITPMEELRRLRVEHALGLILTTHSPLKVIARESGFANEYALSHMIRKYHNLPPGAIRTEVK